MRTKEKRVIFTSSKLNDTNHLAIKHHLQFQKVSKEIGCFNRETGSSKSLIYSQSIDEYSLENIPNIPSIDIQENSSTEKYNIAYNIREPVQSNAIRSFGHTASWKYKNPYSISIKDLKHYENLNYVSSEKNLKGDEPQEGRKRQNILPEYLANLQISCDTSSSIQYSFAAVIIIMAQATARSLWALLYMIINIAPIIQMFSFILKFALEKVINIRKTRDLRQAAIKFSIFAVQLLSIYVCLTFIIDIIVLPIVLGLPIVQLISNIVRKFI